MNRMGACFDRLRCEVFQNLFLSPMNTGFLGSAVATVLTVYGIETVLVAAFSPLYLKLQQYLPFTVLKLRFYYYRYNHVYRCNSTYRLRY